MTKSIVKKIFVDDANRRETTIKKAQDSILAECNRLQTIVGDLGNDDAALAVIADGQFAFIYDKTSGKKNKPSMSASMRQIKGAMLYIASNPDEFDAWCNNGEKTGVTSLRGIKDALEAKKPKKAKTQKSDDLSQNDESESDADETETIQEKTPRTKSELYENFLTIWKAAGYGDSIAFAEFVESTEAMKIADKVDAQKAA